ncbi:hypothetical protein M8494_30890 [Serratia ureilytica]
MGRTFSLFAFNNEMVVLDIWSVLFDFKTRISVWRLLGIFLQTIALLEIDFVEITQIEYKAKGKKLNIRSNQLDRCKILSRIK